jgi:hypothetical protein
VLGKAVLTKPVVQFLRRNPDIHVRGGGAGALLLDAVSPIPQIFANPN